MYFVVTKMTGHNFKSPIIFNRVIHVHYFSIKYVIKILK